LALVPDLGCELITTTGAGRVKLEYRAYDGALFKTDAAELGACMARRFKWLRERVAK